MPKLPLRIEVVRSSIVALSSLGMRSALDIVATLSRHYTDVILTNIDTVQDLQALVERKPDLVFAGIYYVTDPARRDAKVWLTDELEKNDIAYTGSGKLANKLSLSKDLAKLHMIEKGIRTAAFKLAKRSDVTEITEGPLIFPLFVKPSDKSSGQGVDEFSIVRTEAQLQDKVRSIHQNELSDALIEEYLSGREFTVAIISNNRDGFTAMPLELIVAKDLNGNRVRSKSVRLIDAETLNEITDQTEYQLISQFAVDAFTAIGGAGHGRIDIRFDEHGTPFFLEANHIPSLVRANSSFLKAYILKLGGSYETLITDLARYALERAPVA